MSDKKDFYINSKTNYVSFSNPMKPCSTYNTYAHRVYERNFEIAPVYKFKYMKLKIIYTSLQAVQANMCLL